MCSCLDCLVLTGLISSEHMVRSYSEGDSTLRAARRVRLCVDAPGWGGKEWGWDSMSRTRPLWPSPSSGSRKQIKASQSISESLGTDSKSISVLVLTESCIEYLGGRGECSILPISYRHVKNRGPDKYQWNNFTAHKSNWQLLLQWTQLVGPQTHIILSIFP